MVQMSEAAEHPLVDSLHLEMPYLGESVND